MGTKILPMHPLKVQHQVVSHTNFITRRLFKKHQNGYEAGVGKVARRILAKSQQYVPVKTGALKKSGYANVHGHGFKAVANVGYSMYYAIWQHENLEFRHAPGKSAKFLTRATTESRIGSVLDMMKSLVRGK